MNKKQRVSEFAPTAPIEQLRKRAETLAVIRQFFQERDFLEVDTPLLSRDTVVDRHLDPIPVLLPDQAEDMASGKEMFLQTSPEFAMKRMLVAGMEKIYQIAHAFRVGESGALHNPEFTIVEWYRVGDGMQEGISLLAELSCRLFDVEQCDAISFRKAFLDQAAVDPISGSDQSILEALSRHNIESPGAETSFDRDLALELLLNDVVQPNLGNDRPVIVFDYPASHAALAKTRDDGDGMVAERFELFYRGVELANGYHELCDPDELLRRNRLTNEQRIADNKRALPEESQLLDAMRQGLPKCAGVALGFDRVVMLRTGMQQLREVIPFPIERA